MNPFPPHRSGPLHPEPVRSTWSSRVARLDVSGVVSVVLMVGSVILLVMPDVLSAQAQPPQPARQMRHFWHVFAAYALAWVLVFGWAVSIAHRLRRIEEKLER